MENFKRVKQRFTTKLFTQLYDHTSCYKLYDSSSSFGLLLRRDEHPTIHMRPFLILYVQTHE